MRTPTSWIDEFLNLWNNTRKAVTEYQMAKTDGDPSLDLLKDLLSYGPPAPSWSASDDQTAWFEYMFSRTPGYGDWLKMRDAYNFMSDYLKNTGMSWSDLLYPSMASGSGSGYGVLNFMSSNIEKFYKNH